MREQILIITCCLVFSGFCRADEGKPAGDPDMEKLIDNISELAAKVLDVFEPLVMKNKNETAVNDAYFVSFLLRGKNQTKSTTEITPKKRMVVNNNFSGDRMATNQTYIESGPATKQSPSHNVQLLNNPLMQAQNHPSQSYQPQAYQPYPQPQQKPRQQQKPQHTFY